MCNFFKLLLNKLVLTLIISKSNLAKDIVSGNITSINNQKL